MTFREFWRYHSFKVILGLVVLQLIFFSWLQYRNHRPEAVTDEYTVYEGHSVNFQPLRNDTDKDDEDEITLLNVEQPQQGEIKIDENKITYTTKIGFAGVDSFAYTIYDGKKESKKAFIKITIEENQKPVAHRDEMQLYQGQEISLALLGNDNDRENDSIFLVDFTQPMYGELKQVDDKLYYSSIDPSAKLDSFQYSIGDGFNNSDKVSVVLNIISKNNVCYPWLSADIGSPVQKGGLSCSGKTYVIKASGNDIWGNSDNFHYAYQIAEGDCEIVTKVTTLENTNPWAKAGIMVRESLAGNAKNVFVGITPENGITAQVRTNTGGGSESPNRVEGLTVPYWIKLIRTGDNFTGYISKDGNKWEESGSGPVPMASQVYIGLAVTSHDNEKLCEVKFTSVKTKL